MQQSSGLLFAAGWTAATPYNLPLRGKLAIESYIDHTIRCGFSFLVDDPGLEPI
jgi:hypothetical protein